MNFQQLREEAEKCRMMAGLLFAFAIVAAVVGVCVWYSLGPGMMLLFCCVVAAVCGLGFFHELADAAGLDRKARQRMPIHFENHGHE
jgi:hypothetical protein